MKVRFQLCIVVLSALAFLASCSKTTQSASAIPHLQKQGSATQLIVDGKPFLMISGELNNSSSSNLEYMKPIWPRLAAMHLNTVLTPVSWELIEPAEGKVDFTLVDGLIQGARASNLRIVFLWFGSWKNAVSSYPPEWVKSNLDRFPRVQTKDGTGAENLSTFSTANRDADARAYAALMRHIKEVDSQRTVIMMQVENEVGVYGDSRDRSEAANKAFAGEVPKELIAHLQKCGDALFPPLKKTWQSAGGKTSGTWEQVFGKSEQADEIFMAWSYASYMGYVTAAGKAEYNIPMYVNTALSGDRPGGWPSGGPQPQVLEVWQAGAPAVDFYSPDIYALNFENWCDWYHRAGNPLFIPETAANPNNLFYALGKHDLMGYSPFAIDRTASMSGSANASPADLPLAQAYDVVSQLAPIILANQGKGTMAGALVAPEAPQKISLGNYTIEVSYPPARRMLTAQMGGTQIPRPPPESLPATSMVFPPPPSPGQRAGVMFINTAPDEYVVAGTGNVNVTFSPNTPGLPIAGISYVEEGSYVNGTWVPGRRLNGDEDGQGKALHLQAARSGIQHVKLYRYR